ncbi:MAG TPA: type II toxin-antitoxin system death-on-curing family toxin [Mycobacteriales bacterium]|nr:type II toxin-antitoxin system death-on-curing family toxin [Mycobacteriales bacterium]HVU60524.1 type II toxin-antitoxin system death-on-curing family toxin [Mycobacteriales bacterium]
MIFLDVADLLYVAERAIGAPAEVRDVGLLEAAAARPQASAFGADAYLSLHEKAAALLHSIVRNHALVDGNKRLGLAAVIAFYGVNGRRLTMTNDEAYDLVIAVAAGDLDDVAGIAQRLEAGSAPS